MPHTPSAFLLLFTSAQAAMAQQAAPDVGPDAQEDPAPEATRRSPLEEALYGGRTWLDLNFRVEFAEQDTFEKDAYAGTLRTALGYETAPFHGFRAGIEFEDIANIGNNLYNSTTNGVLNRPVVADPDSTEINQVYAAYTGLENFEFKVGRQEISYGNLRFIGSVAWRQNHQSFDAARVDWTPTEDTRVSYAYLDTVHRIFGELSPRGEEQMSSHLLDVRRTFEGVGDAALYGYFLDFDRSATLSSATIGARFAVPPSCPTASTSSTRASTRNRRTRGTTPSTSTPIIGSPRRAYRSAEHPCGSGMSTSAGRERRGTSSRRHSRRSTSSTASPTSFSSPLMRGSTTATYGLLASSAR